MALTLTRVSQNLSGTIRENTYDVVLDSAYATGGEALTPAQVGLVRIETLQVVECYQGYVFAYDRANQKLKVFYGDNNNAADGPLIEVPNGTDLSAVSGRLIARGH